MRRSVFVSVVLLSLIVPIASPHQAPPPAPEKYWVLRVTSGDPGREVKYEGSYMFRGEGSPYKALEAETPFEVTVQSDLVAGMFRAKSPTSRIHVELADLVQGPHQYVTSGTGRALLVDVQSRGLRGGIHPF